MDPIEWRSTQEKAFSKALHQAVLESAGSGQKVAVLSLKMSGMRRLRGLYGREFIDQMARTIHDRIQSTLRPSDHMQALGGCEFLLCLPYIKNTGHLRLAIKKLITQLEQEFELGGQVVTSPPAIGASLYPDTTWELEELINTAEHALAQARSNDDTYQISEPLSTDTPSRWDVEEDFRRGINQDELILFYQPQIELSSGKVIGAEALIRWNHPDRGLITPSLFIPVIEQTDIIHEVTHWCLHRALRELKDWLGLGLDLSVSVNIASRNFREPSFNEIVMNALGLWDIPSNRLILEITESAVLDSLKYVSDELGAFREAGVRISIDDFGTGYSSLSYLSRLPIDELKIDRSFIRKLTEQEQDQRIVAAIVQMANEFRLNAVAEGIEDPAASNMLKELGCQYGQGYHIARPMPADDFSDWLIQQMT
jgi:diguanylate cyclase (GGDEF)-like protein